MAFDTNNHAFAAIRGIQAGAAYYTIMCPLRIVPRLLSFDDETLPPQLRAQRVLNRARVPGLANYITENSKQYILSSLCASVDGELEFTPAEETGPLRAVGTLRIGMNSTILINDGQHRRAAIEEALRQQPSLGDESISVVIFVDRGLQRAQQMFADLNNHAVRSTRSLKLLYDHRNKEARLTKRVVEAIPLFRQFTDLERTSIPHRTNKLFTLSGLHQATEPVARIREGEGLDAQVELCTAFWEQVIEQMPEWKMVYKGRSASVDLRQTYLHAHGVAIHAIGIAGAQLLKHRPNDMAALKKLRTIDWMRTNKEWEGRAMVAGRLNKAKANVLLVSNVILRALNVPLTPEGDEVERQFLRSQRQLSDPGAQVLA